MRRKLRLLASAATLLLVLAAVGLFVYRIGSINSSGERSSEAEYSILRNTLASIQSKAELDDEALKGQLLALYQGSDRLLAAQVLDGSGLVLWRIPATSHYFASPSTAQAQPSFVSPSASTVVQSTPMADGMRLTALYTTFRRSDVSKAALPSFVMALAWFIVLALALIFQRKDPDEAEMAGADAPAAEEVEEIQPKSWAVAPSSGAAKAAIEAEATQAAEEPATVDETVSEPGAEDDIEVEEEFEEAEDELAADEAAEKTASGIGSSWLSPSARKDGSGKNFEESLAKLEEEVREWSSRKPLAPAAPAPAAAEPSALPAVEPADASYEEEIQEELEEMDSSEEERPIPEEAPISGSPESEAEELLKEFEEVSAEEKTVPAEPAESSLPPAQELGKRDLSDLPLPLSLQNPGLESRLSGELGKSGADLALILIHCGLASDSDPAAAALSSTLKDYIGTSDLITELYKGAFAVVLPSVDLGAALKMSEDLADVLAATYSLYRDLDEEAPVYLGISARSNRQVDAFKLYREASTAVHKAYSGGPSKILAFRPKSE